MRSPQGWRMCKSILNPLSLSILYNSYGLLQSVLRQQCTKEAASAARSATRPLAKPKPRYRTSIIAILFLNTFLTYLRPSVTVWIATKSLALQTPPTLSFLVTVSPLHKGRQSSSTSRPTAARPSLPSSAVIAGPRYGAKQRLMVTPRSSNAALWMGRVV